MLCELGRSSRASFSSEGGPFYLEVFITEATPAPARSLASLRWIFNQAKVNMDLQMIQLPRRVASRPHKRGQAAVMEPSMVNHLERRIVQMFEAGEERWSALLGGWLVKHVTMAEPRKITQSALHAHCPKGKQKKLRQGFSFMIPSTFLSGFFFEAWKALPRATQRTSGLCFARDGRPWALSEVNLVLRAEFLSTYSFRRVAPTLGSLLKFSGTELCALGDWQDRSQLGEESRMPMHYSGARYLLSFKQKFLALGALKTLQDFTGWEGIPTVQLEPSKKAGEVFVGRAQARDEVIIWAAPPNMEELRSRLRVSIQAKVAAAKRKAAVRDPGHAGLHQRHHDVSLHAQWHARKARRCAVGRICALLSRAAPQACRQRMLHRPRTTRSSPHRPHQRTFMQPSIGQATPIIHPALHAQLGSACYPTSREDSSWMFSQEHMHPYQQQPTGRASRVSRLLT